MLNQEEPKEYILSSNETHSVREFVEKSFKFANINEFYWVGEKENECLVLPDYLISEGNAMNKILVKINPKFYRPAEVDLLLGDSSEAREQLKWKPEISFDQLIERMIRSDIEKYKS
jgi:GDPmannose 4,6-dehydratase